MGGVLMFCRAEPLPAPELLTGAREFPGAAELGQLSAEELTRAQLESPPAHDPNAAWPYAPRAAQPE